MISLIVMIGRAAKLQTPHSQNTLNQQLACVCLNSSKSSVSLSHGNDYQIVGFSLNQNQLTLESGRHRHPISKFQTKPFIFTHEIKQRN